MSENSNISKSRSPIFRTVATDYYEYWVEGEISKLFFYTEHFSSRDSQPFKSINKDQIERELQVSCWMPTSMAINFASDLLKQVKIRVECPHCKTTVDNFTSHIQESHKITP